MNRVSLDVARTMAGLLLAQLAPVCERVEIAGSVRRGRPMVGDLEVVAIPRTETRERQVDLFTREIETVNRLDLVLDDLVAAERVVNATAAGKKICWGPRQKRFWMHINPRHGWLQVDLFLTVPEAWGAIFCLRTGPEAFSKALVTHFLYRTPYRQQDGGLIVKSTGCRVSVPTEEAYFDAAGLTYIPPGRRTVAELALARRTWIRLHAPVTPDVQLESTSEPAQHPVLVNGGMTTVEWLRTRLLAAAGVAA